MGQGLGLGGHGRGWDLVLGQRGQRVGCVRGQLEMGLMLVLVPQLELELELELGPGLNLELGLGLGLELRRLDWRLRLRHS